MTCTSDKQDAECVRRILEGDTDAFEELVVRYQKPVFNAICRMVHDPEDAREIAQTAFMKAFTNLRHFDQDRRFFSWIYRIAMNDSINFLASRRETESLLDTQPSDAAGPEETYSSAETRKHLDEALANLTPEYRAVIVVCHILGFSYHDAAEALGIPEKTVKSRLFRAREILRDHLVAMGYRSRSVSNA